MKKMISFQYLFIMGCSFLSLWSCTDHKKVTFETTENRLIKHSASFYKPTLSAIKPTGWLHHYLTTQKNGITGHLDAAGGYPFNLPTWSDTAKVVDDRAQSTWWPFEQTGYWIEGMIRTGRLLEDEDLIRKARKYMDYPIEKPSVDGFIGPSFMKEAGKTNRWAHVVYFRALMTEYEATQNPQIVETVYNHLKYDLDTYPYRHVREMGIIESMLWTYEHTRDESLLKRAEDIFVEGNKINTSRSSSAHQVLDQNRPINEHGVTFLEFARLGAILYMYTGKSKYLEITQAAYRKVEKQALLVDGVNSSTELLKGKDPLNSHETCDIVEVAYGWCKMLQATGDPTYADKIEKAAFNAGPGAVTADYKAMQYFSCPNQVIAGNNSNHNDYMKGNSSMQFAPSAWIKCCPGQVSRSMPLYASQFWYVKENHIFTGTYGPNTFSVTTGSGETVQIDEKTNYPFEESILFKINTEKDIQFALNLRIPGWCSEATVELNGHRVITSDFGGQYVRLDTLFKNSDEVLLHLPMRVNMSKWPRNTGAIEYGPLVFSLGIEEKREIDATSEWSVSTDFPALNLSPTSNWNYAFAFRQDNFQDVITVSRTSEEVGQWSMDKSSISIKIPVRKIRNWEIERQERVLQEDYWPTHKADTVAYWNKEFVKLEGDFAFTPNIPTRNFLIENVSQNIDTIQLVPYGFTNLRMTIFPLSPID
ncbi:beta-L-arabinofuranosidase domain-containing protein [Reichenbachiella sp.]|uniref:beta-L-arabinofuranosidase domain-containing protein n=1 Tax=Reichenbachiella sp. TaxID=2184521 RepID=UPI003298202C